MKYDDAIFGISLLTVIITTFTDALSGIKYSGKNPRIKNKVPIS